jgi:hypothetical protein
VSAPQWTPVCNDDEPPTGFGSLLHVLTLGLIPNPPPKPTKTDIMAQIGQVLQSQLNSKGWSVDQTTANNSIGYYLNTLDAWDRVLTDANTTQAVVNGAIHDLLGGGMVTVSPGQLYAMHTVNPDGSIQGVPAGSTASNSLTSAVAGIPPAMLWGGAAMLALVLLKRR